MSIQERIDRFLGSEAFGVAGASSKRHKYGNKVLRCYLQNGRRAIPINPIETEIEGAPVIARISDLPDEVQSLSLITPPQVTEKLVVDAAQRGIRNIWMQPGAESAKAIAYCEEQGLNLIADGSCLLVVLGYREQ